MPRRSNESNSIAQQIMTPDPVSLEEGTPLIEAARLMKQHKFGSIIVVNRRGIIRGIVTEGLIATALHIEGNLQGLPVESYMIENPPSVAKRDDIKDVLKIMIMQNIDHVVVVDKMRPVGIISHADIIITTQSRRQLTGQVSVYGAKGRRHDSVAGNTEPSSAPVQRSGLAWE